MNHQQLKGFVSRRFAPERYLGLHLTIGLVLSLCLLGLFVAIARTVEGKKRLTEVDEAISVQAKEHRELHPALRAFLVRVTDLGSASTLTALALVGAAVLLALHRRLLALVWVVAPAGGGLLDSSLKVFFDRERPELRDPAILETNMSFPSGHSMASLIGYGLLAYVLCLSIASRWARCGIVLLCALLVMCIGASRVYLGAHYLSDVLGGFAVGGFWLATCITALGTLRRRPKPEAASSTTSGTNE